MWPWGHLAVAYLSYYLLAHLTTRVTRSPATLLAVVIGSQVPDLVDKPLAWGFGVLPSGRSLAHSLITAAIVLGILYWIAGRYDSRDAVVGLGLGWITHSLSDLGVSTVVGLFRGDLGQLEWTTYLLWPLLPSPPYPNDESFLQHLADFEPSSAVLVQFLLFGVVLVLWATAERDNVLDVYRWVVGAVRDI